MAKYKYIWEVSDLGCGKLVAKGFGKTEFMLVYTTLGVGPAARSARGVHFGVVDTRDGLFMAFWAEDKAPLTKQEFADLLTEKGLAPLAFWSAVSSPALLRPPGPPVPVVPLPPPDKRV